MVRKLLCLFGNPNYHFYHVPDFDVYKYTYDTCIKSNDEPSDCKLIDKSTKHDQETIIMIKEATEHLGYDIRIIAKFGTILPIIPHEPGLYVADLLPSNYKKINSIQVISDNFIISADKRLENFMDSVYFPFLCKFLFHGKVGNMEEKLNNSQNEVFFVPSVIYTSNEPLSYSARRSILTPQERFHQTLEQVKSIRLKYPSSSIYLLEGSELSIRELLQLIEYVDKVILFCLDRSGNYHAHQNPNKSHYEMYVISETLFKLQNPFTHFFKFGGRYKFADFHNPQKMLLDKPTFKKVSGEYTYTGYPIFECIIYSIPYNYKTKYQDIYQKMLQDPDSNIETDLLKYTGDDYTRVLSLDVIGTDAIHGVYKCV